MSKRKPYKKRSARENPDPERYILVETKEGSYFRLKRGLNKPAVLNAAYQQSSDSTMVCSPAAKRMAVLLRKPLQGLGPGRLIARFTGLLRKAFHQKGIVDFSFFGDYDFQRDHPLDALLQVPYQCHEKDGVVHVQIPVEKRSVKKHNSLVTEYYFDLVLLYGDASKDDGLRVDSVTSPPYSYATTKKSTCTLSLALPEKEQPWMVMLKISSLEGNELAHHPRHYGMKVVMHGNDSPAVTGLPRIENA
jgi:hypothetical protein